MGSKVSASSISDSMQLHIYSSLRNVTMLPGKGVKEFIKVRNGSRRLSHFRAPTCSRLVLFICLWMIVALMVMQAIHLHSESPQPSTGWDKGGRRLSTRGTLEEIYKILEENQTADTLQDTSTAQRSLKEFLQEIRMAATDAEAFATMLKAYVTDLEDKTRSAKIREYLYRHVASTAIPRYLHCLVLNLAGEYTASAAARVPLPAPPRVPALVDNGFFHFVLASDNVLAASVVATSLARNARDPGRTVLHVVTERKTHTAMHAWFALHPLEPVVVEVKGLHQFDWVRRGRMPVTETMEKDREARSQFRGGSEAIVSSTTDNPRLVEKKLQALSPKYNSIMNHIRVHLPELFPSLKKVVFLDDDVVVQADLSPLWDIDLRGKVNGAVQTCSGHDKYVMSKRLKTYLNFSHPLIASQFDPMECAWAYGMNVFDLEAWRKTNVTRTYHHWIEQNLKSDLSLWQLGTLPPGLIAFRGNVQIIDRRWHMLGLGYQARTSLDEAKKAAVIHFNGRAKPWLEIGIPQLRELWSKYVDFSDRFVQACNIVR